jgi:hypothetical protein
MSEPTDKSVPPDVNTVTLILQIDAQADFDAEKLRQLTGYLRSELKDMDLESVTDVRNQAVPPGAKVVDPLTLGAIIVVVLPEVLPKVLEYIQAWTLRHEGQTIKIKAQHGDRSVDVEYPLSMSPDEAKKHIDMVKDTLF